MINNPSLDKLYEDLRVLIESKEKKEHKCSEFLYYIDEYLTDPNIKLRLYEKTEYRFTTENLDYVLSVNTKDEGGSECVKAYIWELRAPQCYIFEKDTIERLKPSKELISAENQLINYHNKLKNDESFKSRAKVLKSEDVKLGGIIIGCNNTKVYGAYEDVERDALYKEAYQIRKDYFYRNDIRLISWDTILEQFKPNIKHESKKESGDLKDPVSIISGNMTVSKNVWTVGRLRY